jgi:hypothetical protein
MEPRDAYRRPEVIAFCDARMLNGDPEMEIDYRDCRPLRNMTIFRVPDRHPHVLLIGRDNPVD